MVFTLHRYIFREVLKVFCLATVALTLMMSLGSILRPVQEYGVSPGQVIHLMGYFLPITLTFVLPMAALFATSLVYGRFAADNELDACRASGISLLPLVYPGLILAIIVAISNLLLTFYVIPAFVHRAESSLKDNARQILFRNVQRKDYYALPPDKHYRIYADNADIRNNTLSGLVAVESADNGEIKKIVTAETAKITFNPHEKFNEVRITAHNTFQMGPDEDTGFSAEWLSLTAEFGSLLGDDIKFKKIDEMKQIRHNPMLFDPIAKLARKVYSRFTAELLARQMNETFHSDLGPALRLHSGHQIINLSAENCTVRDEKRLQLDDAVITEHSLQAETGSQGRTLQCRRAFLDIEGDELAPTLTLDARNATWQVAPGLQNIISRYIIRGLIIPAAVTNKFKSDDILSEISPEATSAALNNQPSPQLTKLQNQLSRNISRTFAAIDAETNSRLVFGLGCITLIMIGIGLGIVFKDGHLLTAFAASAIPAMVLVACIMMGKNIAKNPNSTILSGIMLMWAGLIFLTLLALELYRRLLKH